MEETKAVAPESKYARAEDGRTIIPLKRPIKLGDRMVTEFRMRDFKAGDLRRLVNMTDEEKNLELVKRMSGEISQVVDELSGADYQALVGFVTDFL